MDQSDKFSFLDEATAREPNVKNVLNEILRLQNQSLPLGTKQLATLQLLESSRNIKIPLSPTRIKAIAYLLDILTSRFPNDVKTITSFDFDVDENTKRLSVLETVEYTVSLNDKDFENIRVQRDNNSAENLMKLLSTYRFFNISKLLRITKRKDDLSHIINLEEGKQIFLFKNYSLDKNRLEVEEDYCFHSNNYTSVVNSINISHLREILSRYGELVARRLRNFGILSTHIADYQDNKLDYIFEILISDLAGTLVDKEIIDVKNIRSLRAALLRAEHVLDPLQTLGRDIANFIKEHKLCCNTDITGSILGINDELLKKWTNQENLSKFTILSKTVEDGAQFFVHRQGFLALIDEYSNMILHQPDKMSPMPHAEKQKINSDMEILYKIGRDILTSQEIQSSHQFSDTELSSLRKIIEEYENHLKRLQAQKLETQKAPQPPRKRSLFAIIIDFIKSLFGRRIPAQTRKLEIGHAAGKSIARETRLFYKNVTARKGPILALSDFIELTPENDNLIDVLISDMREHNLKIVIPIYKAQEVLYPKRSQKVLMPDIEYLLVSPEVGKSPESIRRFTDSLLGYKIKDEVMPAKSIMAVEKYLLTLYRQKRAMMLKKEF